MKKKPLIIACVIFGIAGVATASAAAWYHHNFHAAPFKPVQLTAVEQKTLDEKVGVIRDSAGAPGPEPAKTLVLSEREINGWLRQQGLGDHIKVDIGGGGIAASALLPVPPDVPLLGGRTLRFKVTLTPGVDLRRHLGLVVSDITVGGVSPPNAWLGGLKGRDLLADAGNDPLMKGFAEGIRRIEFSPGELRLILND